jgi:beta-phosphoglucomutase-like phosphatase (HAD superfamily)
MVRNIDLVEALIFYGTASIFYPLKNKDERIFLPGVEDLIEECKRDETAVIAILDDEKDLLLQREQGDNRKNNNIVVFKTEKSPPPNPRDLWDSIHSLKIKPKGFGGSSGFGRKIADPERSPSPPHCVVLCDTVDKCRAARFAGMRVLCLTDNDLADGVMNFASGNDENADLKFYWESINMDDIAMPGSFWINPPLPKDDEGDCVNVLSIIESYEEIEKEKQQQQPDEPSSSTTNKGILPNSDDPDDGDDDEYLKAILMDMDPL